MQWLFLFGKLSGLNDREAALAAGHSVSVAENTKQRIWKPRVRAEFERLQCGLQDGKGYCPIQSTLKRILGTT
jgi:phage terminase small subunit